MLKEPKESKKCTCVLLKLSRKNHFFGLPCFYKIDWLQENFSTFPSDNIYRTPCTIQFKISGQLPYRLDGGWRAGSANHWSAERAKKKVPKTIKKALLEMLWTISNTFLKQLNAYLCFNDYIIIKTLQFRKYGAFAFTWAREESF